MSGGADVADLLPEPQELSDMQRMFVEHYLSNGMRPGQAAKAAGYKHPEVMGSRLAKTPHIKAVIEARIKEAAMGADEVLFRLKEQASANMADFLLFEVVEGEPDEKTGEKPKHTAFRGINWAAVEERGHLIKSVTPSKYGGYKLELVDGQAALFKIGQHCKLFTEKIEVSDPNGQPLLPIAGLVAAMRQVQNELKDDAG